MHLSRYQWFDPYERCGIIVQQPWGLSLIELPNRHEEPVHHFTITAGDVRQALAVNVGASLFGFFHTHPGDRSMRRPSTKDLHMASQQRDYVHAMYHPYTRTFVWYDHTGIVAEEYVRPRLRAGRIVL